MKDKKEALQQWKSLMCHRMLIVDDKFCLTPYGKKVSCKSCPYDYCEKYQNKEEKKMIKVKMEVEIPESIYSEFLAELERDELVQIWYYAAQKNENMALFLRKEEE